MNAKSFFVPALGISALLAVFLAPMPSKGEPATDSAAITAITALLGEVAAQQAAIAENQARIDAKLAIVTENVRVARLFVARGK